MKFFKFQPIRWFKEFFFCSSKELIDFGESLSKLSKVFASMKKKKKKNEVSKGRKDI